MKKTDRIGYVAAWLSVAVNTIMFGFKFWAGMAFASVAMRADAWHTLSDTVTSLIVIAGFWVSARRPDPEHPFGHGRAGAVAAVIVATLLGLIGVEFLRQGALQLMNAQAPVFGKSALIIFAIAAVMKEAMAAFSIRIGKRIKSPALVADGWHHRSDAIASAVIVIGGLLGARFWWADGILGLAVAALIMWTAGGIFKESFSTLLGEKCLPETEEQVIALAMVAGVGGVHHFHAHRYGDHVEVTFHISLPPDMPLKETHETAQGIEDRIREELGIEATIHVDPMGARED